jgi:hypothetical protein
MPVAPDRARAMALALPDASEAPHFHRLAFRTPRKIFATLDAAARDLNLMFDPDLRDFYCEQAPLLRAGAARLRAGPRRLGAQGRHLLHAGCGGRGHPGLRIGRRAPVRGAAQAWAVAGLIDHRLCLPVAQSLGILR